MSNTRVYKSRSVIVLTEARRIAPKEVPEEVVTLPETEGAATAPINGNVSDKEKPLLPPTQPQDLKKEHDQIITQARTEAQKITQVAQQKAKEIENKAYEKGFIAGKQQGISEGQELGKQEVCTVVEALNHQIAALDEYRLELVKKAEGKIINLVLDIAKKVIRQEVAQDKNIVVRIAAEGIKRITEREKLLLRINKDDLEVMKENRETLLACADGIRSIEFQEDGRVESGGCIIDTAVGTLDLRVESQIGVIDKAFKDMLEAETGVR